MANLFTRYTAKAVGIVPVTLLTASASTQTTAIGLTAANTSTAPITVDAYIYNPTNDASFTGAAAATDVLTVSSVTGIIYAGTNLVGPEVADGTTILNQLTSSSASIVTPAYVAGGAPGFNSVKLASMTSIAVGQIVTGTGLPDSTFVVSVNANSATVTLSNDFTVQAAGNYTFKSSGGAGTYTISSSQTITSATLNTNNYIYVIRNGTVPVGSSLALFGGDTGRLVLNTSDRFTVVSSAVASADIVLSVLEITP